MKAEFEQILCPCGCGILVGRPMEQINGEWFILPISAARLQELALTQHRKTRSPLRNEGRSQLTLG
jgi:hypothetical protein